MIDVQKALSVSYNGGMRRALLLLAAVSAACGGGVQTRETDMTSPQAQGTAVATFAAG